ncbi:MULTISPECIES: hypothetical protein [unclassified Staphylococcus]|uniref:hypothetical protein n=1 Tax=unclassified Staphylococcus TaxID=91994 RepID=UPI0021CFC4AD|nr:MULTISPECIES: hypothetical protein [unclassified Staphylococcus]UXR78856.1 hypothetical protein MUA92_02905 [Staphylococcus sp. IVB6227]UXR83016.1 hypothetical protein MUA51_02875 [Staphylococcus sp. IVB6214]
MLYIKYKSLFLIGILLFVAMFYFKVELGDSIFRPLGYLAAGAIMGCALAYKEK